MRGLFGQDWQEKVLQQSIQKQYWERMARRRLRAILLVDYTAVSDYSSQQ